MPYPRASRLNRNLEVRVGIVNGRSPFRTFKVVYCERPEAIDEQYSVDLTKAGFALQMFGSVMNADQKAGLLSPLSMRHILQTTFDAWYRVILPAGLEYVTDRSFLENGEQMTCAFPEKPGIIRNGDVGEVDYLYVRDEQGVVYVARYDPSQNIGAEHKCSVFEPLAEISLGHLRNEHPTLMPEHWCPTTHAPILTRQGMSLMLTWTPDTNKPFKRLFLTQRQRWNWSDGRPFEYPIRNLRDWPVFILDVRKYSE